MFHKSIWGLCILFLLAAFTSTASATGESYPATSCPHTDSPNFRRDEAVSVESGQLFLKNTVTDRVIYQLDKDFLSLHPPFLFWGQNCRYFFALNVWQPAGRYPRRFVNIYDTFTGRRIFQSFRDPLFDLRWSPSKAQFIIKSVNGTYLMSEMLDAPVFLFKHYVAEKSMRRFFWDTKRGQLLVIFAANAGYLNIYDVNSGAVIAALHNPKGCSPPLNFKFSTDERYLMFFTDAGWYDGHPACMGIYDRDTGGTVHFPVGEQTAQDEAQIALSPGGRYLAIGVRALRVWDLSALPAAFEDRQPTHVYEGPIAIIKSLRFVDEQTVETVSSEGVSRWNILTGEAE